MMENAMLSPDRMSDLAPLSTAAADYDVVRRAIAHIKGNWRTAAGDRADRRSRRRHADRAAPPVPPLGRAHPQGVPAGAHPRQRAQSSARFRERARRLLRGRAVRPRPAARSVRHPRGDVARRMEDRRRRADDLLRLPSRRVRHRAGDGDGARPLRARVRRSRRGKGRDRRHAPPLAAGELHRGLAPAPRRSARASSTRSSGARTGRCASC